MHARHPGVSLNEVRADIDRFLQSARGSNNAWSGAVILPAFIRRNIKLAEAPSYGQTIFEYAPDCNGADDYSKVARFLLGVEDTPAPEPEPELATAAPAPEPTPELQADNPAEEPAIATAAEPQSDSPEQAPLADALSESQGDNSEELSSAAEPASVPEDAAVETPPAAIATEFQGDSPAEAPLADVPQDENPEQAAPFDTPPEPQNEGPSQTSPGAPPIPIVSVNLPAPRCYSPVPIGPEPPGDASAAIPPA